MTGQQTERFLAKLSVLTDYDCWQWQGSTTGGNIRTGKSPYGNVGIGGKVLRAHRVAWELQYGPIPEGMGVLHHCDNTLCCNPLHLFLGTQTDNMVDMVRKKRGVQIGNPKLTPDQIVEVRALFQSKTMRSKEIAERFGIHRCHVWRIGNGIHGRPKKP